MARQLKIKPVQAVGHLTTLWGNVLELAEDGNITKWSVEDIAEYAGWEGDPKEFYKVLKNEGDGFLDEKEGVILIHDWIEYVGRYLKAKYKSHNPEKLEQILTLYGKTFVKPKLDNGKLSNQSNQSNQSLNNSEVLKILKTYKDLKGYTTVPNSFYARNYQRGAELLKELKTVDEVIAIIKWWADFSEKEGLDWTLETVINKIPEYLKYKNTPEIERKWIKK